MLVVGLVLTGIAILFVLYVCLFLLYYRLPSGSDTMTITDDVFYKFIELEWTHRMFFETYILQNSFVRLVDNSLWYVSKADKKQLWPESPHNMSEKGYTIRATLKIQSLLFRGYGKARLETVERINKIPKTSK